LGSLDEYAR
nr:RecName: Full=Uncharacterized protein IMPP5 [Nautilus macromphalus]